MYNPKVFEERKRRFVDRLYREIGEGRVDFDIVDFLKEVNKVDGLYTTSSCSGRIMVVNAKSLSFAKGRGLVKIVAKWHRPVTIGEVRAALGLGDNLWLMVRGPIIHTVARDMGMAIRFMNIAKEAGFKRSSIISVKDWGIVIETESDDRLDLPIKIDGSLVNSNLESIIDVANETLMFGKFRLARLIRLVEEGFMGRSYGADYVDIAPYRVFKRTMGVV